MFQTDKNIKTDGTEEAFVLFWIPLIFLSAKGLCGYIFCGILVFCLVFRIK